MIERRMLPSGRVSWRVRWYDPDGRERSRSFPSQKAAKNFDADRRAARDSWTSPERGSVTLGHLWAPFLASQTHLKPLTIDIYGRTWVNHVEPHFGRWPVSKIGFADVSSWVGTLSTSSGVATTRKAFAVLSRLLAWCTEAGYIGRNPATGVRLPRPKKHDVRVATPEQLEALFKALPTASRPMVELLAFTGLRWGEAAALECRDVDLNRRVLRVRRTTSEVGGVLRVGPPKSHQHRDVPIIDRLSPVLRDRTESRESQALVFATSQGTHWRNSNFRRNSCWSEAVAAAGLPGFRVHDLRHTAASLMLSSGASVVDVSAVLGHANSHTTLTVYAHLVGSRLDDVSTRLNRLLEAPYGQKAARMPATDPSEHWI